MTTRSAEAARAAPGADCPLCPRLVRFREAHRAAEPAWFNAPVPSFGPSAARLLVIGLAPGLRGANRTGRPFTGDYAGEVLYPALTRHGFGAGTFAARVDDGFELVDCRIANAVRCVPPENKPTPAEVATCRRFLVPEVTGPDAPRVLLALGRIAHDSVLRALGIPLARHAFAHGAVHRLATGHTLVDTYHTSRYNMNTGRLTAGMFDAVAAKVAELVAEAPLALSPAP